MSDQEALRARLEAAKAATADARAELAPTLEDQVAAAELEAANAAAERDASKKLGRKHVDYEVVPVVDGSVVIVKRPDPVQFQAFMDLPAAKLEDIDAMGSRCVHYPDAGTYRKLKTDRPGLQISVAKAASRLAGIALDEQSGKS